jgi:hypothetical protein
MMGTIECLVVSIFLILEVVNNSVILNDSVHQLASVVVELAFR